MSMVMQNPIIATHKSTTHYDTIVVGAGPYGLSIAAHLLDQGLKIAVFGKPLQTWQENMPKGMLLRSFWWATNFSDLHKQYSVKQFFQEIGRNPIDPLSIETVIDYGLWFQSHKVPQIDETFVKNIDHNSTNFRVTLMDGRSFESDTIVMAPGLQYFTHIPAEYSNLSQAVVTHTSAHQSFEKLAGKRVVIIGGGQGALETAALASEQGVNVQVVSRHPLMWIQSLPDRINSRPLIEKIKYPKAGITPGWYELVLEHFPYLFQRLSRPMKDRILQGPVGHGLPLGAAWLKERFIGKVFLHEGVQVKQVQVKDGEVILELSNNKILQADHIILGTGYKMNINRLTMLHPTLLSRIQIYDNAPVLNNYFESSVPGLYFVGFSSTSSCGPLYRFVVGTEAAAKRVTYALAKQIQKAKRHA